MGARAGAEKGSLTFDMGGLVFFGGRPARLWRSSLRFAFSLRILLGLCTFCFSLLLLPVTFYFFCSKQQHQNIKIHV